MGIQLGCRWCAVDCQWVGVLVARCGMNYVESVDLRGAEAAVAG